MVKFGRHLQFFLDNEHKGSNRYVVPYNDLRPLIHSNDASTTFPSEWRNCRNRASTDFYDATQALWCRVFAGIAHHPDSRGALPDVALRLYVSIAGPDAVQELLSLVKEIHSAALINSEALRKLVKKYDKVVADEAKGGEGGYGGGEALSPKLLPEVYAANFTVGQSTLEAGLALLRSHLHLDEDDGADYNNDDHQNDNDDDDGANDIVADLEVENDHHPSTLRPQQQQQQHDSHQNLVNRKKDELHWLRNLISTIPPSELIHLVAHRGFHSPQDRNIERPLENSLSAYEAAWTSGVKLCECDVALTRDEKLILAHDEDFSRLALDPTMEVSSTKVGDLTFRELMALPLKSGIRPPLLFDVLRSARTIGNGCQLVIEIKPGNSEAGSALARMFLRHPELMEHCAVVMSFDAFAMHNLRRELVVWSAELNNADGRGGMVDSISLPTSMSLKRLSGAVPVGGGGAGGAGSNAGLGTIDPYYAGGGGGGVNVLGGVASGGYLIPPQQYHQQQLKMEDRKDSAEHFGVGLSDDGTGRKDSFSFTPFNSHQLSTSPGLAHSPKLTGFMTSAGNNHQSNTNRGSFASMAHSPGTTFMGGATPPSPSGATTTTMVPKLILLTVAEPPKKPCELWADVSDLSPVQNWLHANDGNLDGVYLQFQREMMTEEGATNLRALADRCDVGVWGHNGRDPDDWETFHWLVKKCGVSYVNTDLPRRFKRRGLHRGVSDFR